MENNKIRISLTFIAALMPMLCSYQSFIPQIEVGTFLAIILFFIIIIGQHGVIDISGGPIQKTWVTFLVVTAVCTAISIQLMRYNSSVTSTIWMRYLKIVTAVLVFLILGWKYFDKELGCKVVRWCAVFNTILVFLQTITHSPLIGRISGEATFRPAGLFYEPSNLASYMVVALCIVLFDKDLRHRYVWVAAIIIGVLLSTSGTGAVLIPVVILMYLFFGSSRDISILNKLIFSLVGLMMLIIAIYFFSRTSIGSTTLGRFITSEGLGGSYTGRFQSTANELVNSMPTFYRIIGYGFGYRPEEYYFNSYNAIAYGDGIIGLILVGIILVVSFFKGNAVSKTLVVCYGCLFMGAGIFNFGAIVYFFSFILANVKQKMEESQC